MLGFVGSSVKFIGISAKVSSSVYNVQHNLSLQNGMKLLLFFNSNSGGGVQPVHSARRPPIGLLYLPRVIMRMENLVE
jgi:hypothetical protein